MPLSRALGLAGARHTSRKVAARNGGQAPQNAAIKLPRSFARREIVMSTDHGREQIAMRAWTHGWKDFERPLPAVYAACLTDGAVVLDVGANTGFYALLAASARRDVHVHAFEPLPAAADQMALNLGLNDAGGVTVIRQAVDHKEGEIDLMIPPTDGAVPTSASLEPTFQQSWASSIRVTRTTIDAYATNLARVDVLKVDVEGAEPRVLEGAVETLQKHRPIVFFEAINHGDVWRADCPRIDAIRSLVDYRSVLLFKRTVSVRDTVRWESGCENQALWPAERIDELRDLTGRLRIAYTD